MINHSSKEKLLQIQNWASLVELSVVDVNRCMHDLSVSSPDRSTRAYKSIFGWVVGGKTCKPSLNADCLKLSADDIILRHFWELGEVPDSSPHYSSEDNLAFEMFSDTTTRDPDGRYIVHLPHKDPPHQLGESKACSYI